MTIEPLPEDDAPPTADSIGSTMAPAAEEDRGVIEPLEPASRRAGGPVARRIYSTGNAALDSMVTEMIASLSQGGRDDVPSIPNQDLDLAREIVTSALRLVIHNASRA